MTGETGIAYRPEDAVLVPVLEDAVVEDVVFEPVPLDGGEAVVDVETEEDDVDVEVEDIPAEASADAQTPTTASGTRIDRTRRTRLTGVPRWCTGEWA